MNTEIASRIVEVASGASFEDFLRERIFEPLRMLDTGFTVPVEKRSRIADMTSTDRDGQLIAWPAGDAARPDEPMRRYASGAGVLYSQYNEGFGLGGFVNLDAPGRERPGSVGAFGWSGAAATYFMVDPRERLFAILLMQHIPQGFSRDPRKISFAFYNSVYQSLLH